MVNILKNIPFFKKKSNFAYYFNFKIIYYGNSSTI
jgi:hypothetical protein